MKSEIKTAIILAVAIGVGIVAISIAFSTLDQASVANIGGDSTQIDKSGFKKAPDLVGIAHYLNTTPEELAQEMEGKVVLYDIWTYSCINCIRTLPYITAWDDKYSDQGLLVIGIHSPEFKFEKVPENVQMSIEKHGINYPVVMDNDMETWQAFENRYWPRKYIADHTGNLRYDHIGEGAYQETEKIIQQLLDERAQALGIQTTSNKELVSIEEFEHTPFRTPELYFGYKFAQYRNNLGSSEGFQPDRIVTYAEPQKIELNKFYPIGEWKNYSDNMELTKNNGSIKMFFEAKEVNIVTNNIGELDISLNGLPLDEKNIGRDISSNGKLFVKDPGMYNIIDSEISISGILEINVKGKGFQAFTFTFG